MNGHMFLEQYSIALQVASRCDANHNEPRDWNGLTCFEHQPSQVCPSNVATCKLSPVECNILACVAGVCAYKCLHSRVSNACSVMVRANMMHNAVRVRVGLVSSLILSNTIHTHEANCEKHWLHLTSSDCYQWLRITG